MKDLPWYTVLFATLILLIFGYLCLHMLAESTSIKKEDSYQWDRIVLIFNAVQTMAAAAAGVLLGTSIQQGRVADAKAQAQDAQVKADANAADAAKVNAAKTILRNLPPPGAAPSPQDHTLAAINALF